MYIVEIAKVRESSNFSVVITDGKEEERKTPELHEEFRQQAEEFIQQQYGEHISIRHSEIMIVEWPGHVWIELVPKISGIMQEIAEKYGLSVQ